MKKRKRLNRQVYFLFVFTRLFVVVVVVVVAMTARGFVGLNMA